MRTALFLSIPGHLQTQKKEGGAPVAQQSCDGKKGRIPCPITWWVWRDWTEPTGDPSWAGTVAFCTSWGGSLVKNGHHYSPPVPKPPDFADLPIKRWSLISPLWIWTGLLTCLANRTWQKCHAIFKSRPQKAWCVPAVCMSLQRCPAALRGRRGKPAGGWKDPVVQRAAIPTVASRGQLFPGWLSSWQQMQEWAQPGPEEPLSWAQPKLLTTESLAK